MSDPSAPRLGGRVRTVVILGFLSAFAPLSLDLYLPSVPALTAGFGTSDSLAQLTMSANLLGLGLGQFVWEPLSDRIGRRVPLLIGVALFTLLTVACAFAPSVEMLVVLRLLQGLAGATGMVVARAVARDTYSGRELARFLSLLMLVGGTAPILAPVIGGALALVMDWRGILLVLAGIGAAIGISVALWLRETLAVNARHAGGLRATLSGFGKVAKDRLFVGLVLVFAATQASFLTYITMSTYVFQDELGFSPQQFSLLFAVNSAANVIGTQGNGLLLRRFTTGRMLELDVLARVGATVLMLVSVLLMFGSLALIVFLGLSVLFQGAIMTSTTALALSGHGERAGTASALLGVGQYVIAPLVGPLASIGGATTLGMVIAMCATSAIAVLLYVVLVDRRRVLRAT